MTAPGFSQTGELLLQLSGVGKPRVMRFDDGTWGASVKFPSPAGVTAEVQSDYNQPTPDAALQQCIDRLGGLRSMLTVPSPQIGATHAEVEA